MEVGNLDSVYGGNFEESIVCIKEKKHVQQNWVIQVETSFGMKLFQFFMQERAFKVVIASD